jgi:hypothetical protein
MADLGQQPDPDRIYRSFRTLTDEFEKLPNIPAFDAGNAILRALEQLTTKLDTFSNKPTRDSIALRTRLTPYRIALQQSEFAQNFHPVAHPI